MDIKKYNRQGSNVDEIVNGVIRLVLGLSEEATAKVMQAVTSVNEGNKVKRHIRELSGTSFKRLVMLLDVLDDEMPTGSEETPKLSEVFNAKLSEAITSVSDLANASDREVRNLHQNLKRMKNSSNVERQQQLNRKENSDTVKRKASGNPSDATDRQIERLMKQKQNLNTQIARLRDAKKAAGGS